MAQTTGGSRHAEIVAGAFVAGTSGEITTLLRRLKAGDPDTVARLMKLIYPELRGVARRHFRGERPGHIMQPTALVHEAYLRMMRHDDHSWANRAHFFGAASIVMRRILVEHARAQRARKRDPAQWTESPGGAARGGLQAVDLIALDDALTTLETLSPRQARIVELRYFGGLTVPEVAEALGVTGRTVDREWAAARAWLRLRLQP
jgi:RNA polymerase sigma factor (TIGR02999 family)